MLLFLVILAVIAFFITKKIVSYVIKMYYVHKLPGPPMINPIVGNLSPLQDTPENIFKVLRQWSATYYPVYKVWFSVLGNVSIVSPEDVGMILSDMKHIKKGILYSYLWRWLGQGLLTSDGTLWQRRRKILTPAFHFTILQEFITSFNEITQELVEILKADCHKPFVEVTPLINQCTLKIIGETSMGKKFGFENVQEKEYKTAFLDLIEILLYRTIHPYLAYSFTYIFSPKFYKEVHLVKKLHKFTKNVISERENDFHTNTHNKKTKKMAMLDLLITTKRNDNLIDDDGIREEVDTFMFEGHDTISAAIDFALMTIANHPKIQQDIVQEMEDILGDIKKKPTYSDLQELKFMERCIKEVLRLYPSVFYMSRKLGEDVVTHSGYKLKKDTTIDIHIYDLHHNPNIYPDPEKFDPDRFLPENIDKRHPYAYIPFSAGPRNCIGQRFAMLEMKALLCGILGNFVLEPIDTPQTITLMVHIILRATKHIKVKFVPREIVKT